MKQLKLAITLGLLSWAFTASGQFYGVNVLEYCWSTGSADSTVYGAMLSAAGTTKPTKIHFFNLDNSGNPFAVNISVGTLRNGPCSSPETDSIIVNLEQTLIDNDTLINYLNINLQNNDTIIVRLDSLLIALDSILNASTEPQQCNCTYSLDLDNHAYSINPNEQYPRWSYERVVTRNCGAGDEEIFRQGSVLQTSGNQKASTEYLISNPAQYLVDGQGVIDSFKVFIKNPDTSFFIYTHPQTVFDTYPQVITNGLDTADLRFNAAAPNTMANAIETVVSYVLTSDFPLNYTPALPPATFDFDAVVQNTGSVRLIFNVYHAPTGVYAAINTSAGSRSMDFHPDYATFVSSNGVARQGISAVVTAAYNLPCDTTIFTTYSDQITDNGILSWINVGLDTIAAPALAGSVGTGTCIQACPEMGECLSICDTVYVYQVNTEMDECEVDNIQEFPVTANGNSVALGSNTYHSVSVLVTSGTVSITASNSGGFTTATFSSGQTFTVSAADCQLLQTGYGINATSGAAIVSTVR